jgi:nicotinamidase-related amidase
MRETPSYRAPRTDGAWLCEPAPDQSTNLINTNRRLSNSGSVQWLGVPLAELRRLARFDLLKAARRYSSVNSEELSAIKFPFDGRSETSSMVPILMSGHQPELFHAGVWFKNFLLSDLAQRNEGIAVNILVDHDLAKRTNLEVPSRLKSGRLGKEVFDLGQQWDGIPWEYAFLDDVDPWDRFVESVVHHLSSVGIEKPLLSEMNPLVRRAILGKRSIGEGFSAARHHIELAAGLSTIEVPFSHLTDCFAWTTFLGEFLLRAEEVFDSLNRARKEFRTVRKISNPTQPIPPLRRNGSWIEIPFWTYSRENPRRRPLWVRKGTSGIEVGDTEVSLATLPSNFSIDVLMAELTRLTKAGLQIRPRALTTTMFLRMAMCDLFIHGIGGGLYDQLTNQIIRDLWKTDCPGFVVATATSYLPFEHFQTGTSSIQESLQSLRDWRFTPERTIHPQSNDSPGIALLETKRKLLDNIPSGKAKTGWHQQIVRLNEAIRVHFANQGELVKHQYENAIQSERERAIATNREFSFALHPKELVDKLRSLVSNEHGRALNY